MQNTTMMPDYLLTDSTQQLKPHIIGYLLSN